MFSTLKILADQVVIPNQPTRDKLILKHSTNGDMTLKEAYNFKKSNSTKLPWAKLIWSNDVPPSKSLMVWRLMLDKLPTDDILLSRGCQLPSLCSLCNSTVETSFHLFFECTYVLNLWRWFAGTINCTLSFQNKEDVWNLCNNSWNPQCKIVLIATLINIFNGVWYARNQLRFQNKKKSLENDSCCYNV
jgi:hypothetical protein